VLFLLAELVLRVPLFFMVIASESISLLRLCMERVLSECLLTDIGVPLQDLNRSLIESLMHLF
jgi:hypothetical protein